MADAPSVPTRYRLSFSVGGLFLQGASIGAGLYLEFRDWRAVRAAIDADNLLQARTVASAKRLGRELVPRLAELTDDELRLLLDATAAERGHLMWVAACRRYVLIGEFAEEVVRERFLLFARSLAPEHFESFVRAKSMWHEELSSLTDPTLRKLRTTVFLMLREAGLLSESGEILASVLSPRVTRELQKRVPSDGRFFPVIPEVIGVVR
jgi:hypothetical protein